MNGKRYTTYSSEEDNGRSRSRPSSKDRATRKARAAGPHLGAGPGARNGTVGQAPGWQSPSEPGRPFAEAADVRRPAAEGGSGEGNSRRGAPGASAYAGNGGAPPRQVYAKPRRRWPRIVGLACLFLFALVCGFGGYWFGWLQSTVSAVGTGGEYKHTVEAAGVNLTQTTGDEPINILLIGSDRRTKSAEGEGDPGRSDTMMLLRLDPINKSISMLSVPRDLWVEIPGYGQERINVAYTLGGPAKTIAMFKKLTGLPIHHFIDVNFLGFVHIVDQLGGAYIDVDRRYYNPPGTGWAAIDLQPGYQLMTGRKALQFVRFRHDETGDYGRMVRQQVFLNEVKRQATRWSSSLFKLPDIAETISKNTISDIDSVGELVHLAKIVFGLNTSKIYKTHIEGSPTMIDGKSVLQPSQEEIQQAVNGFTHPKLGPIQATTTSIPRDSYTIRVLNGSGTQGMATQAAAALTGKGYNAEENGNADSFDYTLSVVYTTAGLEDEAGRVAKALGEATVKTVPRLPGTLGGMSVIVGSQYTGEAKQSSGSGSTSTSTIDQTQLTKNVNQDAAQWRVWAQQTPLHIEMPTAWSPGMTYMDSTGTYSARAYTIPTGSGQRAAFVVVGRTQSGGYWHIQATSWTDPPIMQDPNEKRTIDGREYTLFYQNDRLHRVAWNDGGTLLWITNTLSDQISNDVMLGLATSCKPVE